MTWVLDVRPGDGVVARWGRYLLAIPGPVDPGAARPLVDLVREAAESGAGGKALLQRLAAHLAAVDGDPAFGVVGPDEARWVALVHGEVTLVAETSEGPVELAGAGRPTWADGYLPEDTRSIEIAADGVEPAQAPLGFDLVAGVVPGAGLTLTAAEAVPPGEEDAAEPPGEEPAAELPQEEDVAEPPGDEPAVEPSAVEEADFVQIDLSSTGDVAQREPLAIEKAVTVSEPAGTDDVLVVGINCKRGHFNHPQAAYCALCGISMLQQTQNPVEGVRPPLGILVFGDGTTLSVDGIYVVGREPGRDPAVAGGEARAFALDDPDQVLSRVHLSVGPNGWDVEVSDRGSANGTYVRPEEGEWERLEPDEPRMLTSGMHVRLGNHQFVYEGHHRPRGSSG